MTPTLGIVGLPELARVLREAGAEVVEGGRWDARAASPISDQLHRGRRFPVLVESAPIPGLTPWIERLATLTNVWMIRSGHDDPDLPRASGWFDLPVGVVEILDAMGLDTADLGSLEGCEVVAEGRIRVPGDAEDAPDRDRDDERAVGPHDDPGADQPARSSAGARRSAPVVRPQPLRDPRAARLAATPDDDSHEAAADDPVREPATEGVDEASSGARTEEPSPSGPGSGMSEPTPSTTSSVPPSPPARPGPVDVDEGGAPDPDGEDEASIDEDAGPDGERVPGRDLEADVEGDGDDQADAAGAGGDDVVEAGVATEEAGVATVEAGVATEEAGADPSGGMTRSTCVHCGEPVYGVPVRHLWWHVETREAECRTGGTTATPTMGPPPPPASAAESTAATVARSEDPVAAGAWSRRGAVVFSAAAKGGVGKTTLALALAAAGAERGLDVVLVDANRGQGDVAHYLRLSGSHLPTVYDAAVTGRPADGVATPEVIARVRQPWLESIGFSLVLGPSSDGQADPDLTTADVYADVVRHAAGTADLVVVDTQILERADTSGLIDRLTIPLLEESGWLLAVTDMSSAGVVNTRERLEALHRDGVTAARVLVAPNRVEPADVADVARLGEVFDGHAQVVPAIPTAAEVAETMNAGNPPAAPPGLRAVVDDVLLRVTGNPAFVPDEPRGGRFRTWFGRGRRS